MRVICDASPDSGKLVGPFQHNVYFRDKYIYGSTRSLEDFAPPAYYYRIRPDNLLTGPAADYGRLIAADWIGVGVRQNLLGDGGSMILSPDNSALDFDDGTRNTINPVAIQMASLITIPNQGIVLPGSADNGQLYFYNNCAQEVSLQVQTVLGVPKTYSQFFRVNNNGFASCFTPIPPFAYGVRYSFDSGADTVPGFLWQDATGDTSIGTWASDADPSLPVNRQGYLPIPPGAIAFGSNTSGLNLRYLLEWLIRA